MGKTITIRCRNTGRSHEVPVGSTLEEVFGKLAPELSMSPTGAKVNNKVEGLHYMLFGEKDVEFIDITSASGMRIYTRSLFFVLYKAVHDVFPETRLRIDTPVSNGYYCHLEKAGEAPALHADAIARLRSRMHEIIAADLPFHRITCPTDEAIDRFRRNGLEDKAKLLAGSGALYTTYYTLDDVADYFYGALLIRTGQLAMFDIEPYGDGLLLRLPDSGNPGHLRPMIEQNKMFGVFHEQHRWQQILGVTTIGDFNEACAKGFANDLINISEALQEKKIARLADRIAASPDVKVILIAGPSSSGKTTFSKRLSVQLAAAGMKPVALSLDDYFVNREDTPRLPDGDYDYENVEAMNIPLFNAHMNALLRGEAVELPRYDFQTGKSVPSGNVLQPLPNMLFVLEGIHALNPVLTQGIPAAGKFRIYASALTTILLDDHNYIPTTDNRLLRRIVRDYKYRGYSAEDTIRRWPAVRAGEEKWIFPFQEQADEMINTALLFEFAALRTQALPLLEQVPEYAPEYAEAYRLRKFLSYVHPIPTDGLPPTSLLREFLGGSTFRY